MTRPGSGALATTRTWALTRAPARSRGRCGPCPRTEPETLERVPPRAGGRSRRARAPASRRRWPSAAARRGSRTVGRGRRAPGVRRGGTTRMGAMSWAGIPIRRRSHQTTSPLPAGRATATRRVPPGGDGRRRGRRGPSGPRRAWAAGRRASKEPSPSMKATYSLVAASRPACTAAPYPGTGPRRPRSPRAGGRRRPCRRASRCRRPHREPAGTRASEQQAARPPRPGRAAPGRRRCSTSATVGRSEGPETVLVLTNAVTARGPRSPGRPPRVGAMPTSRCPARRGSGCS